MVEKFIPPFPKPPEKNRLQPERERITKELEERVREKEKKENPLIESGKK